MIKVHLKVFWNIEQNEFKGNDSVVEDNIPVPYDSQEQLPSNIESQQEQEVVAVVSKEEEANEEEPPYHHGGSRTTNTTRGFRTTRTTTWC